MNFMNMWVTESCLQLSAQKDKPILASHIHREPLPMADAAPVQRAPATAIEKKSIADLRTQLQKRRRILKRTGNLEPEDLAWLQEQLRLKREAQEAEATTG